MIDVLLVQAARCNGVFPIESIVRHVWRTHVSITRVSCVERTRQRKVSWEHSPRTFKSALYLINSFSILEEEEEEDEDEEEEEEREARWTP